MTPQREQLEKRFSQLPEDVRQILLDSTTDEKVVAIGKECSLHIDQIGELDYAVVQTLFGLSKSSEFVKNITNRLKIDDAIAQRIAADVNTEIFLPIRESLKRLSESRAPELSEREQILLEIENPPTASVLEGKPLDDARGKSGDIVEQEMEGMFSLPTERKNVEPITEDPPKRIFDPYLEPPE